MLVTIYWSLNESPCGIFVDANLRIDEYDNNVFIQTLVSATNTSSGSFQVDDSRRLKAYAYSVNTPSFAWPTNTCCLILSGNSDDLNDESMISRICGQTIDRSWGLGTNTRTLYSIDAFSFIGQSFDLNYVYITPSYYINATTATCKFVATESVNTNLEIHFSYRINSGTWVDNQIATIYYGNTESPDFIINVSSFLDEIEFRINDFSPPHYGLYVYRPGF